MGVKMNDGTVCPTWNDVEKKLFTPEEIAESNRRVEKIGIAKDKIKLSDNFDDAFDALDKEIADEFEDDSMSGHYDLSGAEKTFAKEMNKSRSALFNDEEEEQYMEQTQMCKALAELIEEAKEKAAEKGEKKDRVIGRIMVDLRYTVKWTKKGMSQQEIKELLFYENEYEEKKEYIDKLFVMAEKVAEAEKAHMYGANLLTQEELNLIMKEVIENNLDLSEEALEKKPAIKKLFEEYDGEYSPEDAAPDWGEPVGNEIW